MGTSLDYHSIQAVPEPARTAVIRELKARNASRTWWAEGICLYDDPEKPEHIFGSTKLFLPGYGSGGEHRKVLPRHDIVMAYCDGKYLVRTFQRLSRRYDITWCLEIEGNPIAVIQRGRLPLHVRLQLIGFGLLARVMARSPFLWVSSRWISRRYADRWDE